MGRKEMRRIVLVAAAFLGLLGLVGGAGSALAGGNQPQEHWTWQHGEALETGALPASDEAKMDKETDNPREARMIGDVPDFDTDPRWKESGG